MLKIKYHPKSFSIIDTLIICPDYYLCKQQAGNHNVTIWDLVSPLIFVVLLSIAIIIINNTMEEEIKK